MDIRSTKCLKSWTHFKHLHLWWKWMWSVQTEVDTNALPEKKMNTSKFKANSTLNSNFTLRTESQLDHVGSKHFGTLNLRWVSAGVHSPKTWKKANYSRGKSQLDMYGNQEVRLFYQKKSGLTWWTQLRWYCMPCNCTTWNATESKKLMSLSSCHFSFQSCNVLWCRS